MIRSRVLGYNLEFTYKIKIKIYIYLSTHYSSITPRHKLLILADHTIR